MIDVAIVGAGLAGLSAAHALTDFNIVVLEESHRAGGRILTRSQMGVNYDLGAALAYDAALFPADLPASPVARLHAPAGIFYQGRVYHGRDLRACLQAMGAAAADLARLDQFRDDPARNARALPPHLYRLLNASFRDIHFGELGDYLPARQLDALHLSTPSHRLGGNGETVAYYVERLGDRLRLQTAVTAIADLGHAVHLSIEENGRPATLHARAAIVATPASVTRRLLATASERSCAFLDSLRDAPGSVVTLGLRGIKPPDFSYLLTPDLATNTILRRPHPEQQLEVWLVYYSVAITKELRELGEAAIVARTLATLQKLGIGDIAEQNVVFSDVAHWPAVGVVISPESYGQDGQWDEQVWRPSGRVWLAGDYLDGGHAADPIPYGMQAALASGGRAARAVARTILRSGLDAHLTHWRDVGLKAAARLAQTAVRHPLPGQDLTMTCHPPPPMAPFAYGDLVPLGLLLRALHSSPIAETRFTAQALQNYLLGRRQQKLWAFHSRRLITATDSALVLLGIEGHAVREALDALEAFCDVGGGYVPQLWATSKRPQRMVRLFDNDHWCQADYATTCVIYALRRAAGLPTGNTLDYLRANFDRRSGLFIANPFLVDWLLALALQQAPGAEDLQQRLGDEIVASINEDDTFGRFDIPFSTALAVLSLATLGYGVGDSTPQRARLRLLDFQQRDGLWPEAVPFYSTRRLKTTPTNPSQILSLCGQHHALYTYHDTPRMITTAVALLALSATGQANRSERAVNPTRAHPRYGSPDHAGYIAQYALPPYLSSAAANGQANANRPRRGQTYSLTKFDIKVGLRATRIENPKFTTVRS